MRVVIQFQLVLSNSLKESKEVIAPVVMQSTAHLYLLTRRNSQQLTAIDETDRDRQTDEQKTDI